MNKLVNENDLIETIRGASHAKEIVLWGAAKAAESIYALLQRHGLSVAFLVDANPQRQSDLFLGKEKIHAPSVLEGHSSEFFVIVASGTFFDEITQCLKKMGYQETCDYLNINVVEEHLQSPKLVKQTKHYNLERRAYGEALMCPVCENSFNEFLPFGRTKRKNAKCPNCGSLERLRLEFLFLKQRTELFDRQTDRQIQILHFAPERALANILQNNPNIEYCSGDIKKGRAMHVVDITNIQFEDSSFDYVICNHVLEHVPNDKKALSEIKRVLKPGGKAIITVPVAYGRATTLEQPTFSNQERLELYRQEDHVRLYGADFPDRLKNAGFKVETFCAGTDVPAELVDKYALSKGGARAVYSAQKTE